MTHLNGPDGVYYEPLEQRNRRRLDKSRRHLWWAAAFYAVTVGIVLTGNVGLFGPPESGILHTVATIAMGVALGQFGMCGYLQWRAGPTNITRRCSHK